MYYLFKELNSLVRDLTRAIKCHVSAFLWDENEAIRQLVLISLSACAISA